MRLMAPAVVALVCMVILSCGTAPMTDVYVSPGGSDDNSGSREKPLATLHRARDMVRELKRDSGLPPGGVTVWLDEGDYPVTEPLVLTEEDAGTEDAPIVYRAMEGKIARLTGGRILDSGAFEPVTDPDILSRLPEDARSSVMMVDLRSRGVDDFGVMKPYGFPRSILPVALELFFDNEPMTIARWPNSGYVQTGTVLDGGSVPRQGDDTNRGGVFRFDDGRLDRWADATDMWLYGYWCWDWAEEALDVDGIDLEKRTIATGIPHHYGILQDRRFYVFNLLEEIDEPGEWYLDRETGVLYFWPPKPLESAETAVSVLEEPMVSMRNTAYTVFHDIIFEYSRGTAVQIIGGEHNRVYACTLRNLGNVAVMIGEGTDGEVVGEFGCSSNHRTYLDTMWNRIGGISNGVVGCAVYNTGDGGVIMGGGDRASLTHAGNSALNNHIFRFCRRRKTNSPAIWIDGVGNIAANNLIHDAPHTAIMFWGNDHRIEYNEIHDVCRETDDAGAVYTGRDWTGRGHVIRYNYIHDVTGLSNIGAQGVYLDDAVSGIVVFGNVFHRVQRAMLIGGGRDITVDNNFILDCDKSIFFDQRGIGWMKDSVADGGILRERLAAVPYESSPWRDRFPGLLTLLDDDPGIPRGGRVVNNVIKGSGAMEIAETVGRYGTVGPNFVTDGEIGLSHTTGGGFILTEDSPVLSELPGFSAPPDHVIGLHDRTPRAGMPDKPER